MQLADDRPVLVGMNNPYAGHRGEEAKYALYPWPENSAGGRLYAMYADAYQRRWGCDLPDKRRSYLAQFDRRNVLSGTEWDARDARRQGKALVRDLAGRRVVVLGRHVAIALGLPRTEWFEDRSVVLDDGPVLTKLRFWTVPHPSGLTRNYNDPVVRAQLGDLLHDLMQGTVTRG